MDPDNSTPQKDGDDALLNRMRLRESVSFNADENVARMCSVIANRASWVMQSMYGERYGLNVLQWRILVILGSHDPLPAKAISEMIATDQVSMSRAIEQMSAKKLVRRRVDPSDRRRQLLRLSDRGTDVYQQVIPLFIAAEKALLSPLSETEQAELRRLLDIVVRQAESRLAEDTPWQDILSAYGDPGQDA